MIKKLSAGFLIHLNHVALLRKRDYVVPPQTSRNATIFVSSAALNLMERSLFKSFYALAWSQYDGDNASFEMRIIPSNTTLECCATMYRMCRFFRNIIGHLFLQKFKNINTLATFKSFVSDISLIYDYL